MRALRNEVLEKYCSTYGCESESHKADESGESEGNPMGPTPALHADACREKLLRSNEAFANRASLLLTIVTVLTDKYVSSVISQTYTEPSESSDRFGRTRSLQHDAGKRKVPISSRSSFSILPSSSFHSYRHWLPPGRNTRCPWPCQPATGI